MRTMGEKKVPWGKKGRRVVSAVLAAGMLLEMSGLWSLEGVGFKASAAENYLEMPERTPVNVMNKQTAAVVENTLSQPDGSVAYYNFVDFSGYTLTKNMSKVSSSSGVYMRTVRGDDHLYYMEFWTKAGYGSWNVTYDWKDFPDESFPEAYSWEDIYVNMGTGAVASTEKDNIQVGHSVNDLVGEMSDRPSSPCSSTWTPMPDHTNPRMTIVGTGEDASSHSAWYVLADMVSPGQVTESDPDPWEILVTEDAQAYDGKPVIWLCEQEMMRPANQSTTKEDLADLKLEVGVVPADDPAAQVIYLQAECVALENGLEGASHKGGALGFQIVDTSALEGEEYQIVSLENRTDTSQLNYSLYLYQNFITSAQDSYYEVNTPVTDLAGNPVMLMADGKKNVRAKALFLDNDPVNVDKVLLSGTNVDASMTTLPGQWPEDLDRTKLFSTTGDQVQLRVQLSERIAPLTQEEMEDVTLTWNLSRNDGGDLVPVTVPLVDVEDGYANGVNAEPVSILVFQSVTVEQDFTPQGVQIQAVSLSTGGHLRDISGNYMETQDQNVVDVSDNPPTVQNFLDTAAPSVTIQQAETVAADEFLIAVEVKDSVENGLSAGMAGGKVALTSSKGSSNVPYQYTFDMSPETPENYSGTGTIGSSGNLIWNDVFMQQDGTYYLHLKLTDTQGVELDDQAPFQIHLYAQDLLGNGGEVALSTQGQNISVDHAAPTVSISNVKTVSGQDQNQNNTATLTATVYAQDLNGVELVKYQWVEADAQAQDSNWIMVDNWDETGGLLTVETTVSGVTAVSKKLVVQAYDVHGNMAQVEQSVTADLTKTIVNYSVSDNLDAPIADPGLVIDRPGWTGETAQGGDLYVRAIMTMDNQTYVGIVTNPDGETLFGSASNAVEWYRVSIAEGVYLTVESGTPDWSYYGPVTVRLNASAQSMTPVASQAVDDETDVTRSEDVELQVCYAPERDDVYDIDGQIQVQDSSGKGVEETDTFTYDYYKFDQSMTGARIGITLRNQLYDDWGVQDVDLENSYALFVRTDQDGQLVQAADGAPAPESVISEKIPFSAGQQQWFSVPAQDLDGNKLTTGAYTLWLHVAQKGGGVQEIYLPSALPSGREGYLLLDAGEIPGQFGVTSYDGYLPVAFSYDNGSGLAWSKTAEEGQTLQVLNVGISKPSRAEAVTPQDGQDVAEARKVTPVTVNGYIVGYEETMNSLHNNAGLLKLTLASQSTEEDGYGQWLGTDLGLVSGMKIWNAGATGDPNDLDFQDVSCANGVSRLLAFSNLDWYDRYGGECDIVDDISQYSVQDAGNDNLKYAVGANTIYYQLKMENGKLSPIYQMQINLTTQSPELELNYSFGPTGQTESGKAYTEYVDVTVANAFSPSGDVKVYYGYREEKTVWIYQEVTDWKEPLRFQANQNGEWGSMGARIDASIDSDLNTTQCLVIYDGAGNAKVFYPSFHVERSDTQYYGIADVTPGVSASASADGENSYRIRLSAEETDAWDQVLDAVDSLTIQVDQRSAVDVKAMDQNESQRNEGGIKSFSTTATADGGAGLTIYGDFPYDPSVEEGAMVEHTIVVSASYKASGAAEEALYETFQVSASNTKPVLREDAESTENYLQGYIQGNRMFRVTELIDPHGSRIAVDVGYGTFCSLPIYENGTYTITFDDIFGNEYQQEVEITALPEDPKISFSTLDYTQDPVTMTVSSEHNQVEIINPDPSWQVATDENGTVQVTVSENSYIEVWISSKETTYVRGFQVSNIYKEEIEPMVRWDSYTSVDLENQVIYGDVTAYLVDQNGSTLVDPQTGTCPKYVFTAGGETSYTFRGYVNQYGVQGPDYTVTLDYEIKPYPTQEADTVAPDVGITGYRVYKDTPAEAGVAFWYLHEERPQDGATLPDYREKYGAENVYTDMDAFVRSMGWAESYRWNVDIVDESAVRLFIKSDLYGEAPTYETGTSDEIPGVKLQGRSLEITGNAQFVLYAVDEADHVTAVSVNITAIGDQVDPEYAQVAVDDGASVRIYLMPPNMEGVTELKITNDADNDGVPDAVLDQDLNSSFYGYSYLTVWENGPVNVFYSYEYRGELVTGQMEMEVTGVDTTPPQVVDQVKWSANHALSATNQEVSAQIQFSRGLQDVYPIDSQGQQIPVPQGVTISFLENQVTVTYDNNAPALTLRAVAAGRDDLLGAVNLDEVDNVDTTLPNITYQVDYGDNHRQAQISFTADEPVVLIQSGTRGESISVDVSTNGVKEYTFTDLAGNAVTVSVAIDGLVEEELTLQVSTTASDSGIIAPATYQAQVGDQLYVKVNRAATMTVSGGSPVPISANVWTQVQIAEDLAGLYPSIRVVDDYGNAAVAQLLKVPVPDRTAPVVLLHRKNLTVAAGTSREEIDALLRDNITAFDLGTPEGMEFEFVYDPAVSGTQTVIYTVRDGAGNERVLEGKLTVRAGGEPTITVDGQIAVWDDILVVDAGTKQLQVTLNGNRYKLDWKAGNKTVGQMKTGSTSLTGGYVSDQERTVEVEMTTPGYYTFVLTTQLHETYRFVVYVK